MWQFFSPPHSVCMHVYVCTYMHIYMFVYVFFTSQNITFIHFLLAFYSCYSDACRTVIQRLSKFLQQSVGSLRKSTFLYSLDKHGPECL